MKHLKLLLVMFMMVSCSSGILKMDRPETITKNEEFDQAVRIKEEPMPEIVITEGKNEESNANVSTAKNESSEKKDPIEKTTTVTKTTVKSTTKSKTAPKDKTHLKTSKPSKIEEKLKALPTKREPDIEDSEGFNNLRRPVEDPFRVGEKVIHEVSYFSATAGNLTLQVRPFTEVNGHKSYRFTADLKTSGVFSAFYSVQDQVEIFMDYEEMVPSVFKLSVKESGQLKEAQSFFDHKKLTANYWEKKYTKKNGHEEKKQNWKILEYSQNAFSGLFYMRVFAWKVGKEYAFRVSDDEKNVIFKGKAIEKVKLKTAAGSFDAIKIKAEIVSRGAVSQTGNLFIWLSDDDRKYLLRTEMEIKIGTIVSEAVQIIPGKE